MIELADFLTPLETDRVFTTLGIRFWDPALRHVVRDNLTVQARPEGLFRSSVTAFATPSGVYAFQGLPGLRQVEFPPLDAPRPMSPPLPPQHFRIQVRDRLDRYLPVEFGIDLPLPFRGVFPHLPDSSPPGTAPRGFYLFSTPTRTPPAGTAAVHAQLVGHATGRPAAHAVMEVEVAGEGIWYGVADRRGAVLVLLPFPTVLGGLAMSPPGSGVALSDQEWELRVRVRFDPLAATVPPGSKLPDIRDILTQPSTRIWSTRLGPPSDELSAVLRFGRRLVMRTDQLSELLIEEGTSPP